MSNATPKLFDTREIDLQALAAKYRILLAKNARLKRLVRMMKPSIEDWKNHYSHKIDLLNARPNPLDYVSEAREYQSEIAEKDRILQAVADHGGPRNCDMLDDEDDAYAAYTNSLKDGDIVSVRGALRYLFALAEGGRT